MEIQLHKEQNNVFELHKIKKSERATRFSCFTTHIPYHKSKKSVQQSVVEMHKELKLSQDQTPVLQSGFEISNPPHLHTGDRYIPGDSPDKITSPLSFDGCWKSEELNGNSYSEDTEGLHTISLKKSQSLSSGLDREEGYLVALIWKMR
ncbi:hypothetical protein QJS10_CPB11g01076 [Acorus calamus]|uniref:Uncharacterized protein n=1 Tax=Acorus calamus TaxID=4465 RepID=A0AAV9DW13_ACOCL|nr:hypothetical protein QJS10_CPB11g01076 [Acorus calamus]